MKIKRSDAVPLEEDSYTLHVRRFPRPLGDQLKVWAATEKISMRQLIIEELQYSVELEGPIILERKED